MARAVYTRRVMFDRLWKKPATPKSPNDVGALFEAQTRFFDRNSSLTIVDAGVHLGHSSKEYLDAFPRCRVFGFEPENKNFAAATAMLAPYGSRVTLLKNALSAQDATNLQQVHTVSLDKFSTDQRLETVDILKMDIQGGELQALKGAAGLLGRGAISVIALEVLFKPLYKAQPLFWDVADHLRSFGYGLHGLFECHYHSRNPNVLSWADAIFTAPQLQALE